MAHEMWELKQKQSLPLKAKIQMTITRVREWYEYWINKGEDVYLSWSGGKDSTVLKHIIDTNLPYYHIKQSQKQLAIEELEKVKEYNHTLSLGGSPYIDVFINNQIKKLKGDAVV